MILWRNYQLLHLQITNINSNLYIMHVRKTWKYIEKFLVVEMFEVSARVRRITENVRGE